MALQSERQLYQLLLRTVRQERPSKVSADLPSLVALQQAGKRWRLGVRIPASATSGAAAVIPVSPRQFSRTLASCAAAAGAASSQASPSSSRTIYSSPAAIHRRALSSWLLSRVPKGFENFFPKGSDAESGSKKNDKKERDGKDGGSKNRDPNFENNMKMLFAGLIGSALLYAVVSTSMPGAGERQISFQDFKTQLLETGQVTKLVVMNKNVVKVYTKGDVWFAGDLEMPSKDAGSPKYYFNIGSVDSFERKMEEAQRALGADPRQHIPIIYSSETNWMIELVKAIPTLLVVGVVLLAMRSLQGQMGGRGGSGGIFQIGKANPTVVNKETKVKTTFADVAGLDEAKVEIVEFVEFLKKPDKFKELGARTPKGALLYGPPGTGKTLLAKAVAGEANVPFFSISGSDFLEMFVGVGPARVRDLFAQARANAPCIIFIDEIDAVGRSRGKGGFSGGGHDERENTLNQLLVEMDGFNTTSGIVVLAGTNRVDILDKALLRPGRFDRQICIDKPDMKGRKQIFEVHLKGIKLAQPMEVYSKHLAALTPGFAGAEIANICNEAALIAARKGDSAVDTRHFEQAIERVIGGLEKKNALITPSEKKVIAYHEAGHAVAGWFLEHAAPLLKVSIVPRGTAALGYAQYLPKEQFLYTKEQLLDMMCMTLAGRVAEKIFFGKVTTGAQDDLSKVTNLAYGQIMVYGFNEKIGQVSFPQQKEGEMQFQKPYSNQTAEIIDEEARAMIDAAFKRTEELIASKKELVEKLAEVLLVKEVIGVKDVVETLGPRPFPHLTSYDELMDAMRPDDGARDEKPASPAEETPAPAPA